MESVREKSICERGKETQEKIRSIMTELKDLQLKSATVAPEESFDQAVALLDRKFFYVAVCGEVSQGKSQFINALIGREVLPVNQHSTTSQVFQISSNEYESYALQFSDGTREPIASLEQAIQYGSALESALVDDPLINGRTIERIEINVPTKNLPPNVILFDTPGLGSLHYSHAQITKRCLASSDAVMFLRTARSPLETTEIKFLEQVFNITDNVLLIQTKADAYDENTRNQIAARDREILSEKFDATIKDLYNRKMPFRFCPISSEMALKSARDSNIKRRQIYWKASNFEALFEALELLIFRTSGYSTSCVACYEAAKYQTRLLKSVETEITTLKSVNQGEQDEARKRSSQNQRDFNEKWGVNSKKMKEVNDEISRVLRTGTQCGQNLFSPSGALRNEYVEEIRELPDDIKEVQEYADGLSERIAEEVSDAWQNIQDETNRKVSRILYDFKLSFDDDLTNRAFCSGALSFSAKNSTLFEKSRNLFSGITIGGGIGSGLGLAFVKVGTLLAPFTGGLSVPISLVCGVLSSAIGFVWGGKEGYARGQEEKARQAKRDLTTSVDNYFKGLSKEFLCPQIGQDSKVVQFFEHLKEEIKEQCDNIIQREKENMERENERIMTAAGLTIIERNKRLTALVEIRDQLASEKKPSVESKLQECLETLDNINQECEF